MTSTLNDQGLEKHGLRYEDEQDDGDVRRVVRAMRYDAMRCGLPTPSLAGGRIPVAAQGKRKRQEERSWKRPRRLRGCCIFVTFIPKIGKWVGRWVGGQVDRWV